MTGAVPRCCVRMSALLAASRYLYSYSYSYSLLTSELQKLMLPFGTFLPIGLLGGELQPENSHHHTAPRPPITSDTSGVGERSITSQTGLIDSPTLYKESWSGNRVLQYVILRSLP